MTGTQVLEQALGHFFTDRALLRLALTHPSVGPVNNQRLEFLGDAVLQICVSELLYRMRPALSEGEMTRLRARLVCRETLSALALNLGLGGFLILSSECEKTGGRSKASILSDALEALLGALYLDGGLQSAAAAIRTLTEPLLRQRQRLEPDSKSRLQELLQSGGREAPVYRLLAAEGPAHHRLFTAGVFRGGRELARGVGKSRKEAEAAAARLALEDLAKAEGSDEA